MALQVSLTASIAATNPTTSQSSFLKTIAAVLASAVIDTTGEQASFGTTPTSVALPISPTNVVYVKNLSTVNTLTVTWTPTGGASNAVATLEPGSVLMLVEAAAGAGITALSFTANASGTLVDYYLAG